MALDGVTEATRDLAVLRDCEAIHKAQCGGSDCGCWMCAAYRHVHLLAVRLAEAEEARDKAHDLLRYLLVKYGTHKNNCAMFPYSQSRPTPCDCGFAAALAPGAGDE